jgi:putative membrane protein
LSGTAEGAPPNAGGGTSTELAGIRTVLAAERTLMAWVRTSLSMISFGFAIYKFLHGAQQLHEVQLRRPQEPRNIGLFLTVLGTLSLVAGLVEHVRTLRRMPGRPARPGAAFYVACAVLLLGVLVTISLVSHLTPF